MLPDSECCDSALQELARRIAEAVGAGEFEAARELTEEAIRVRAGATESATADAARGGLHTT
jgi:hypothetical protein